MIKTLHDDLIAGSKTAKDWDLARAKLINGQEVEWRTAIDDFFVQRLELRYLNPIKILQDAGTLRGEGFSIVAIQCSLIEFLESTYQGKNYRYSPKRNKSAPYEYSSSKDMFVAFLLHREPIKGTFSRAQAIDFYEGVRCGLLHEARTKNGWRIRARASTPTIVADVASKILYRDGFQRALLAHVERYKNLVPFHSELQKAFIRKFDSLSS